jgi:broad specificity phosphatase PhoE
VTTIYICRHGETENNKNNRLSGWIDTPLTDEGIRNASASAAKLRGVIFDRILSSDLGRAFVTAYIISRKLGYTAEIERLAGLREVDYGSLTNMFVPDVIAAYPDLDTHNPGGETMIEMQQRVMSCLSEIGIKYQDRTILLVCHDGPLNAMYASFIDRDIVTSAAGRRNAHDFVARLHYADGQIISFEEVLARP